MLRCRKNFPVGSHHTAQDEAQKQGCSTPPLPANGALKERMSPQASSLEAALGGTTQASKPAAQSLSAKASAFSLVAKAPA